MDESVKKTLDLRLASGEISVEEYNKIYSTIREPANEKVEATSTSQMLIASIKDELFVYEDYITHKGVRHEFDEVNDLHWSRYKQTINFISIGDIATFWIQLTNGEKITYSTDTILFRGFDSINLEKAFNHINKVTHQKRLNALADTLFKQGYADIPSSPEVRIFSDGRILDIKTGLELNIKEAAQKKQFWIGTSTTRRTEPYEVTVYGEGFGLTRKKIIFTIYFKQQLWTNLLSWISKQH